MIIKYKSTDFDSFIYFDQFICNRYVRTILLKLLRFILQKTSAYVKDRMFFL